MADAKFALKILLEQTTEIKKNEVTAKSKLIDAHADLNEVSCIVHLVS
jgi:hypothetical protein